MICYRYSEYFSHVKTQHDKPPATWWFGGAAAVVSVPVLQPADQLVGTALISLLANHSLQREWAVLVHPQQAGILPFL